MVEISFEIKIRNFLFEEYVLFKKGAMFSGPNIER